MNRGLERNLQGASVFQIKATITLTISFAAADGKQFFNLSTIKDSHFSQLPDSPQKNLHYIFQETLEPRGMQLHGEMILLVNKNSFLYMVVSQLPRAAETKYHTLAGWKPQKCIHSQSGGWKSEIQALTRVPSGCCEREAVPCSVLTSGISWTHHSNLCLCLHVAFFPGPLCILLYSSQTLSVDLEPTPIQYDCISILS